MRMDLAASALFQGECSPDQLLGFGSHIAEMIASQDDHCPFDLESLEHEYQHSVHATLSAAEAGACSPAMPCSSWGACAALHIGHAFSLAGSQQQPPSAGPDVWAMGSPNSCRIEQYPQDQFKAGASPPEIGQQLVQQQGCITAYEPVNLQLPPGGFTELLNDGAAAPASAAMGAAGATVTKYSVAGSAAAGCCGAAAKSSSKRAADVGAGTKASKERNKRQKKLPAQQVPVGQEQQQHLQKPVASSSSESTYKPRVPSFPRVLSHAEYNQQQAEANDALTVRPVTHLAIPQDILGTSMTRRGKRGTAAAAGAAGRNSTNGSSRGKRKNGKGIETVTGMLCEALKQHRDRAVRRVNLQHQLRLWKSLSQTEHATHLPGGSMVAQEPAAETSQAMPCAWSCPSATSTATAPGAKSAGAAAALQAAAVTSAITKTADKHSALDPTGGQLQSPPPKAAEVAAAAAVPESSFLYETPEALSRAVEAAFISNQSYLQLALAKIAKDEGVVQMQVLCGPLQGSRRDAQDTATGQQQQQPDVEQLYARRSRENAKLEKQHAKAWAQVIRSSSTLDEATHVAQAAMKVAEIQQLQLHPDTLEAAKHRRDVATAVCRFEAQKKQKAERYAAEYQCLYERCVAALPPQHSSAGQSAITARLQQAHIAEQMPQQQLGLQQPSADSTPSCGLECITPAGAAGVSTTTGNAAARAPTAPLGGPEATAADDLPQLLASRDSSGGFHGESSSGGQADDQPLLTGRGPTLPHNLQVVKAPTPAPSVEAVEAAAGEGAKLVERSAAAVAEKDVGQIAGSRAIDIVVNESDTSHQQQEQQQQAAESMHAPHVPATAAGANFEATNEVYVAVAAGINATAHHSHGCPQPQQQEPDQPAPGVSSSGEQLLNIDACKPTRLLIHAGASAAFVNICSSHCSEPRWELQPANCNEEGSPQLDAATANKRHSAEHEPLQSISPAAIPDNRGKDQQVQGQQQPKLSQAMLQDQQCWHLPQQQQTWQGQLECLPDAQCTVVRVPQAKSVGSRLQRQQHQLHQQKVSPAVTALGESATAAAASVRYASVPEPTSAVAPHLADQHQMQQIPQPSASTAVCNPLLTSAAAALNYFRAVAQGQNPGSAFDPSHQRALVPPASRCGHAAASRAVATWAGSTPAIALSSPPQCVAAGFTDTSQGAKKQSVQKVPCQVERAANAAAAAPAALDAKELLLSIPVRSGPVAGTGPHAALNPGQLQGTGAARVQRRRRLPAVFHDCEGVEEALQEHGLAIGGPASAAGAEAPASAAIAAAGPSTGAHGSSDNERCSDNDDDDDGDSVDYGLESYSGKGKGRAGAITLDMLRKYFDVPMEEAARALGIGKTKLKERCRELKINRWPSRKRQSLWHLMETVRTYSTDSDQEGVASEVCQQVQKYLDELLDDPNKDLDSKIKRLRQAISKLEYKARKV